MTPAEALEFGIIDEIVVKRPHPEDEIADARRKGDGKKKD